ncbi:ROK family protein [Flagellimonas sediminis]|uniref:ROK family protein n=1 Tax=Flagellimonas sediminis TaxID=2696468 RepID=A0A6I5L0S6_9FLAO|nr:ROK family protein [Allomuricauda sediminis]NDV43778.1 ROK family protein [Allomuricauda sediminis]
MYSIGVDVGGSHITSCVYNHKTRKLEKETLSNKKVDPQDSKTKIIDNWVACISETIRNSAEDINGIGMAMPGPFDYYNGICKIANVDKLQSLYNVNIRLELSERLKIKPTYIRFINDASAFSIAEALIGPASVYNKIVAITLGTGLGASFLINGRPIMKDKSVPESGYLYNQYYHNTLADELFSTRGIINAYANRTGKSATNVKDLSEEAKTNGHTRKVFEDFGTRLGDFIRPYLNDFDAEALVLGGNISKAFDLFGPSLQEQLGRIPQIYVSEFGEEAAIIGSALLLDEDYYSEIKEDLKLM